MEKLKRFGVSIDSKVIDLFDKKISKSNYPTRSKAISDLINEYLVKEEWQEGKEVAGTITIVYDHHKRELVSKLTSIQHNFHNIIISSQHIHLDHDNCLEVIIVKGNPKEVKSLANLLKATKGVKHAALTMTSTGKIL